MNDLNLAFGGWLIFDRKHYFNFYKRSKVESAIGKIRKSVYNKYITKEIGYSSERNIKNLQTKYKRKYNTIGSFTFEQWKKLVNFYCPNNECLCCKRKRFLVPDHIIPVKQKGTNFINNIQPICEQCNSKKIRKIIDYREDKGLYTIQIM